MKIQLSQLLISITLIAFSANIISAQDFKPSFILNSKGDTVFGTGQISKDQKYCMFRSLNEKEYTKRLPNEIKAFKIIDGGYFISKEIVNSNNKSKWYFLEFLVEGEINLYFIKKPKRFFMEKANNDFIEINDNHSKHGYSDDRGEYVTKSTYYLGIIKIFMKEAPELYDEIEKLNQLDQRKMVNLTVDYHNTICDDYSCIVYSKEIPKITYKVEGIAGLNKHNAYYTTYSGILLDIWRPLRNEKLFLQLGLIYSDRPYANKDFLEIDQRQNNIKLSIRAQYIFGKNDLKPYLSIGYLWGRIPGVQGGLIYSLPKGFEINVNGSLDFFGIQSNELFNNDLGHSFGCGVSYKL